MWYVPTDQIENIRRVPGPPVTAGETMRVSYIFFDAAGRSGDSPLKDVRVRRGIAYAIDRPQFTKSFFGAEVRVLAAPCFYNQFGCLQDAAKYEFDLAKAKQLMAEAGYPNGFDTELYAFRERKWVDALGGYMRTIGLRAKINLLQYPALRDNNHSGVTPISFSVQDERAAICAVGRRSTSITKRAFFGAAILCARTCVCARGSRCRANE
jgi:peptide/nickel transport system substrate-binding protein